MQISPSIPVKTKYCFSVISKVSAQGIQSTPLNLAVSWRCESTSTDLRIDYKYNTEAMTTPVALNNVQFLVPIDGGVTKLQAVLPPAVWYESLVQQSHSLLFAIPVTFVIITELHPQ